MLETIDQKIAGLQHTIDLSDGARADRNAMRELVLAVLPLDIQPQAVERINVLGTYAAADTQKGDAIARAEARHTQDTLAFINNVLQQSRQ